MEAASTEENKLFLHVIEEEEDFIKEEDVNLKKEIDFTDT